MDEAVAPGEDEILSILVALVEALKTIKDKNVSESKDLERLMVVCIAGYLVLGTESSLIKEVMEGVEAKDILSRVDGEVAREAIGLL